MASKTKTIRVVVKTASLTFKGVNGEGEVSLIEESPISVLADKGATGRHYRKRYHLKVEGFRVFPGDSPASDDAMYVYIMHEKLDAAQVNLGWTIKDGKLVSSSIALRSLHNTSDSEIVLFNEGIGGSLKGGENRSEDNFKQIMKTLSIHDLLVQADKLDMIRLGDSMVKKFDKIFKDNNVKVASALFVSESGGVGDQFLQNPPYNFKSKDLKNLHTAIHHLREKYCSGKTTMEQEIVLTDVEEIKAILVIQPPNIKPMKGSVNVAAYCNFKDCRRLEDVVKQQKEAELAERLLHGGNKAPLNVISSQPNSRSGTPEKGGSSGGAGGVFGGLMSSSSSSKAYLVDSDISDEKRLRLELTDRLKKVKSNQTKARKYYAGARARTPSPKSMLLPSPKLMFPPILKKNHQNGKEEEEAKDEGKKKDKEKKKKDKKKKKDDKKDVKFLKDEGASSQDEGGAITSGGESGGAMTSGGEESGDDDGRSSSSQKLLAIEESSSPSSKEKKKKDRKKDRKKDEEKEPNSPKQDEGSLMPPSEDEEKKKKDKKEKKKDKKDKKRDKKKDLKDKDKNSLIKPETIKEEENKKRGKRGRSSSPHVKNEQRSFTPPLFGKQSGVGGTGGQGRRMSKKSSAFIFEDLFRDLKTIEDGRTLARKMLKFETDVVRKMWRRERKLPEYPKPLSKSQLKKHGPEPSKTKRLKWKSFDRLLTDTCGLVALPPRVMLVHEAVSSYYSLGSKGIDTDAVSVALLLISRVPCMEASPAFITPCDAFEAFDTNRDAHLDQPEYDEAMRTLYGANISESSLAATFVDHCDGSGQCNLEGFFESCAVLSDTTSELWKRKSLKYPPTGQEINLNDHGYVAKAEEGNFIKHIDKKDKSQNQNDASKSVLKQSLGKAAGAVGGGLSYVIGLKSSMIAGMGGSFSDMYAKENYFIKSCIKAALHAVIHEEKLRSQAEEANRWAAAEEASKAGVQIKKNAAIASREEATRREKRAAEASVVEKRQAEMKAKVRSARKARIKLVAAVEIEQKRMERQRREDMRADCGADVLVLKGLGMHKLGDYLDPKGRNGMHGVPRPRLAISQLVELDVSDNKLFGALEDDYLFQLESVLRFEASHNRITSALGLQQLASCRIMRLSHNLIGPTLPDALGIGANALLKLESLSLDNNKLETLPATFGGMKALKRLYLFNNQISAFPNHGCLGPLTSLVELRLRHNILKQLPLDMGGMVSLQVLDLAYNLLMELPQSMSGLSSLRHLDLSFNQINEIEEVGLIGLKSLQFLELHHNLLIGRAPRGIGDLPCLNTCDLSYNKIEHLSGGDDAFECCTMLERLVLSHNLIGGLPAEIGKLTRLHTLECSSNQITGLPPELGALQALHVLVLKTNKLVLLPPEIACLSSLQSLDLSENKILRLPPSFSTMVSLTNLDMSHNQIKSPVPSSLGLVPNLETLHLQGNQISSLPETLGYLRCLKSLDVSNNLIISLPDSVSLLRRLNMLDLRRNNLESLPIGLGTLKELRTVEVGENPLNELPRSFIDPSSDEILKWVKTELVFYRVAVREWEAHEKSYSEGVFGLEHFLEQVAKGLPLEFANAIAPSTDKKRHADVIKESPNEDEDDDDDDEESSYAPGSVPDSLYSLTSSSLSSPKNSQSGTSKATVGSHASSGASITTNGSMGSDGGSNSGLSEKRLGMMLKAREEASKKASAQLLSQVTSFFFKCRSRGVPPVYASVSMNETEERREITQLTQTRRSYRASLAKDEEDDLFESAIDDEVRRYKAMFNSREEEEGMELVDPLDAYN